LNFFDFGARTALFEDRRIDRKRITAAGICDGALRREQNAEGARRRKDERKRAHC